MRENPHENKFNLISASFGRAWHLRDLYIQNEKFLPKMVVARTDAAAAFVDRTDRAIAFWFDVCSCTFIANKQINVAAMVATWVTATTMRYFSLCELNGMNEWTWMKLNKIKLKRQKRQQINEIGQIKQEKNVVENYQLNCLDSKFWRFQVGFAMHNFRGLVCM